MKIKKLIILFVIILLFNIFVNAEQQNIGIKIQNSCIDLIQNCANCTYVNFTAVYSPNMTLLATNLNTTQTGSFFNKTFCNTSTIGMYIVNGIGDVDGIPTVFAYTFEITPDGTQPSTSQGMMYSFILIILLILFAFSTIGAFVIKGNNEFTLGGDLVQINFNKYYKIGLFFLSYLLLIFITFTTWQISINFLFLNIAASIFNFLFTVLIYLLAPVFVAFVIIGLVKIVLDVKLHDLASRGLKPYDGDKR